MFHVCLHRQQAVRFGLHCLRLQGVQRQLSCWLRDQVHVFQNYGAANSSLVQFFKQQAEAARKVGGWTGLNPKFCGMEGAACPGSARWLGCLAAWKCHAASRGGRPAVAAAPCRAWWMAAARPLYWGQRVRLGALGCGQLQGPSKRSPRVRLPCCATRPLADVL